MNTHNRIKIDSSLSLFRFVSVAVFLSRLLLFNDRRWSGCVRLHIVCLNVWRHRIPARALSVSRYVRCWAHEGVLLFQVIFKNALEYYAPRRRDGAGGLADLHTAHKTSYWREFWQKIGVAYSLSLYRNMPNDDVWILYFRSLYSRQHNEIFFIYSWHVWFTVCFSMYYM